VEAERLLLCTHKDPTLPSLLGLARKGVFIDTDEGGRTSYPPGLRRRRGPGQGAGPRHRERGGRGLRGRAPGLRPAGRTLQGPRQVIRGLGNLFCPPWAQASIYQTGLPAIMKLLVIPPSTGRTAPVTKLAFSEARKRTASATSSGLPSRLRAWRSSQSRLVLSGSSERRRGLEDRLRGDGPGGHGVHPDAQGGQVQGQGAGQVHEPPFGGVVGGVFLFGEKPLDAGYVDDGPTPHLPHLPGRPGRKGAWGR
jgi:hypothetical protein